MNKIYIIVLLCIDKDKKYIDYVNKRFDNKNQAKEEMLKCANEEYSSLKEDGIYELVVLNDRVGIYDSNKQLITRYEVIEI